VSTEIDLGVVRLALAGSLVNEVGTVPDRVMATASDRPSPSQDSLPALVDPAFDHQHDAVAPRRADVEEKHRRVNQFLDEAGFDAVLLGRSDSLAWFSSGGNLAQTMFAETGAVQIFINPRCRVVICDNVQTARTFEEELAGLGFQLKEWPWHSDPRGLLSDLTRGKRVATDGFGSGPGLFDERVRLRGLRYPFTRMERQRLRELGRTVSLTLEAACRNFEPGETEADLAGHLAHRLIREGVVPVDLRVAADDRLTRYRQPLFKSVAIQKRATVMAVGRRHGLCAAATRTVNFGTPDSNFQMAHALAAMVDATCIYFSRPGESVSGVFRRARRIFEK
jgi:Xaa-Pro aminopeptidase